MANEAEREQRLCTKPNELSDVEAPNSGLATADALAKPARTKASKAEMLVIAMQLIYDKTPDAI